MGPTAAAEAAFHTAELTDSGLASGRDWSRLALGGNVGPAIFVTPQRSRRAARKDREMTITAEQVRLGRRLLGWSQWDLASPASRGEQKQFRGIREGRAAEFCVRYSPSSTFPRNCRRGTYPLRRWAPRDSVPIGFRNYRGRRVDPIAATGRGSGREARGAALVLPRAVLAKTA
jgi:hypothetical protein